MRVSQTTSPHRLFCIRKTRPAIKRSAFALLKTKITSWNLAELFDVKESDLSFRWKLGSGGEISCIGLDDPDKLKSLEGATGFFVEEADEMTDDDLRQINLRLRGLPSWMYPQIMYAYNPSNMAHVLYERYHKNLAETFMEGEVQPDVFVHKSTYLDNPFLDEAYKRELEHLKDEDEIAWRVYAKGLWAALRGLIYTNHVIVPASQWPLEFEDEFYGLDFGFNNPSALLHIGLRDQEPYLRQHIYQSHLTNSDLIVEMKNQNIRADIPIYADAAEPARIEEICQAGYDCRAVVLSKRSVADRVNFCKKRRLHIHEDGAETIKEVRQYRYKEEKKTGTVTDEPVKFMDHAMNAFEYGFYEHCYDRMSPGVFTIKQPR
jgi:phage terminase large subunit